MEKIKKILLIFSLMLFINVRNVYADTIINYVALSQYSNYSFPSSPADNYLELYSLKSPYNDFNYNYLTYSTTANFYNKSYMVFYNETEDIYLYYFSANYQHSNLDSRNCKFIDSYGSLTIQLYDIEKEQYTNISGPEKIFILSNRRISDFSTIISNNSPSLAGKNNGNYFYRISKLPPDLLDNWSLYNKDIDYVDFYGDILVNGDDPEPTPTPPEPTPTPSKINLNKFYVPNYEKGNCVEILDKDTIRVFENENVNNYTDYFINSNYISKTGQVDSDYVKSCSTLEFSNIRYYGNDFPQILFIVFCITLFTIGFPYILYKRFRKR